MSILTVYNSTVQSYIQNSNEKASTSAKKALLSQFIQNLEAQGLNFEELFPYKQREVLDEILYCVSGCGIWKIGSETLAKKANVSVKTVNNCVKKLKDTGLFIVARLIAHGPGKYVFVSKLHPNLKAILAEVFKMDKERITEQITEPFTEPEKHQSLGAQGIEGDFSSSNLTNSFNLSKQDLKNNNIYINLREKEAIKESIDQESIMSLEQQEKQLKMYANNPMQLELFNFIKMMPFPGIIKDHAYKLALVVGSDAEKKDFVIAKDVITHLAARLNSGYSVNSTIRAVFEAAYLNARKDRKNKVIFNQEDFTKAAAPKAVRKVQFYNWLEVRE